MHSSVPPSLSVSHAALWTVASCSLSHTAPTSRPLLLVTMALAGANIVLHGGDWAGYAASLPLGLILPSWPNGGWSIAVELHFYVILPFLLVVLRRNPAWLALSLLGSIALRTGIFLQLGEVKTAAYFTIIGRYDDFVLGILAFQYRHHFARRHRLALLKF